MEVALETLYVAWPSNVVAPPVNTTDPMYIYDTMFETLVGGYVKSDSSPGYPGLTECKTNQDLIGLYGPEFLSEVATERVLLLSKISFAVMESLSAMDQVRLGLTDPIRVFVKSEPHTLEKINHGRFRLINSVSLTDQMVERFLCSRQNKREINCFQTIPSMPGMGNHEVDEDVAKAGALLTKELLEEIEDRAGTDARAYDWTNTHKTLMVDARFRARLQNLDPWENLYTKRQLCLSTAVMVFDDGTILVQRKRGVQKSGSFNTSAGNCRSRVVSRIIAVPEAPLLIDGKWQVRVMGDDCVENMNGLNGDVIAARYLKQNLRIKEVTSYKLDGFVEFCGLEFRQHGIFNPRALKSVVKFLLTWPEASCFASRLQDFEDSLSFCPHEREYYSHILRLVKIEMDSRVEAGQSQRQ